MNEAESMIGMDRPNTVESLAGQLRTLGVRPGEILLVHASLSKLGWICGGSQALILSILEVLGPEGTLCMPAHSGDWSDPVDWQHPPVPADWVPIIRSQMPAYRTDLTPTRGLGRTAETFRSMQGTLRSSHPQVSFCAFGPLARRVVEGQTLDYGLGDDSPLGRLYGLNARILMLGTDYGTCTALHLAEHRADWPGKCPIRQGAPIMQDGKRVWVDFDDWEIDSDDFPACGAAFEAARLKKILRSLVGRGESILVPLVELVDFGSGWFSANRKP
jgi:aminoglycoside 3-N-acetyltransferase